jgi:hypothetical protein
MRATIGDSVAGNYFFFHFSPMRATMRWCHRQLTIFFWGRSSYVLGAVWLGGCGQDEYDNDIFFGFFWRQFLMCWALYGSEEAGKIIEEPFGITREYGPNFQSQISEMGMLATENLPLLRYCQQIKRDIQDIESMWANLESTTPQVSCVA